MPSFLITIFISIFLRLLTNDAFLQKIVKILVVKIRGICFERGLTMFVIILDTFLTWLDTEEGKEVLYTVAANMRHDKATQNELKSCIKEAYKK